MNFHNLKQKKTYNHWREQKINHFLTHPKKHIVEIKSPTFPSKTEINEIIRQCNHNNLAFYQLNSPDNEKTTQKAIQTITSALGLLTTNNHHYAKNQPLTAITVSKNKIKGNFIPYTNKAISWHTDGYYNTMDKTILSFVLHCITPAEKGGDNKALDPEMLYIHLYDADPMYIKALSQPNVFSIPEFRENNHLIRDEINCAVININQNGHFNLRYTERKHNIHWNSSPIIKEAIEFIRHTLATSPYQLTFKLKANEGLINNNILHTRSSFSDHPNSTLQRRLLRGRYFQRITSTLNQ